MTDQPSTQERLEKLEAFVRKLASEDWRGNKPNYITEAERLLDVEGAQRDALGLKQPFETVPSTTPPLDQMARGPAVDLEQDMKRIMASWWPKSERENNDYDYLRWCLSEWGPSGTEAVENALAAIDRIQRAMAVEAHLVDELAAQHTKDREEIERLKGEVSRLRRIFEVLANEDWRGNKPLHVTIAEGALEATNG